MSQRIINKPTMIWELGTDCLTEFDCKMLDNPDYVSFTRPEGAIIHVETLKKVYKVYSTIMKSILDQAIEHNYDWVMFDCDIETMVDFQFDNRRTKL